VGVTEWVTEWVIEGATGQATEIQWDQDGVSAQQPLLCCWRRVQERGRVGNHNPGSDLMEKGHEKMTEWLFCVTLE
jgi:hypothetical protein